MEKLEFITNNISYTEIEDRIVNFYDLGYPDSSNFMELETGINSSLCIIATKGNIEFSAIVGKNKEQQYIVTIMPKNIKRKK